jgi:hypothetical protein
MIISGYMRKTDAQTLGEVIKEYLKSPVLNNKYKQYKLISAWETILGKTIAKSTINIYVKSKTLYVFLKSSVIRNELYMIKGEIIKRLNENAGEEIITEIILK